MMPTGLVKSMIQAFGAAAAHLVGDVEHDRDRAQRLREPAGTGRLLSRRTRTRAGQVSSW